MKKLLIICGPTATGKTTLGIQLAHMFHGEIISADSRQVFRGMDIVTGKDLPLNSELRIKNDELGINNEKLSVGFREKERTAIWLVDIVDPDYPFNIANYHSIAYRVVNDIWSRGKLPIVVGGSGLYIRSFVDLMPTMFVPPNHKIRKDLGGKEIGVLQYKLRELDTSKWRSMNDSDSNNPRRLIRAIEVAAFQKENKQIPVAKHLINADSVLWIGLRTETLDKLYPLIDRRVDERMENGVISEIKVLTGKGYSWHLNSLNTCGVRDFKEYLEEKEALPEAVKRWKFHEHLYARKQLTWFKKEKRIIWFDISKPGLKDKIEAEVRKWYTDSEL